MVTRHEVWREGARRQDRRAHLRKEPESECPRRAARGPGAPAPFHLRGQDALLLDAALGQIRQEGEGHVRPVPNDDFARLKPFAQGPGLRRIVVLGRIDDHALGQTPLQVQPDVALGGRFAPPMLRPVQAGQRGRVYKSKNSSHLLLSLSARSAPTNVLRPMHTGILFVLDGHSRWPTQPCELAPCHAATLALRTSVARSTASPLPPPPPMRPWSHDPASQMAGVLQSAPRPDHGAARLDGGRGLPRAVRGRPVALPPHGDGRRHGAGGHRPLDTLAWEVRTTEDADPTLAQEQAELLLYAYNGIDNLRDATRALAMAAFRGFAILDKVPADADGRIARFDPIEQWFWIRPAGEAWQLNRDTLAYCDKGDPVEQDRLVVISYGLTDLFLNSYCRLSFRRLYFLIVPRRPRASPLWRWVCVKCGFALVVANGVMEWARLTRSVGSLLAPVETTGRATTPLKTHVKWQVQLARKSKGPDGGN